MQISLFKNVLIIGQSIIAQDIFNYILKYKDERKFILECIVYDNTESNPLIRLSERNNVPCFIITEKEKLKEFFIRTYREKTLIISAFNTFIFPAEVVDSPLFTIINYHNSYLPKYQGGNAISWAIYNEEKYTGATWHYVDNNIDTGDIIWQKLIRIDEDAKAYEISKESMMCAFEGFQLFFIPLLESKIKGKPQETAEEKSFHFRSQLPHGGCINIYDPPKIIYKLLRAMDYGKVGNHVRVRIKMSDKEIYEVQSYKLEEGGLKNEVIFDIQKGYVYIPIGERRIKIKLIN